MTEIEFDKKYTLQLNAQQREAVHAVDGAVLLLAVPGSGKTTVLLTRLAYMLCCRNIPADRVLTMTYTVAATREMGQRFRTCFGEDCPKTPEFRTINGVSAKIIEYYSRNHGSGQAFALMDDEGELSRLTAELYREYSSEFVTPNVIKDIRKAITYVKNMMLSADEIKELDTGISHFPEIYDSYCARMKKGRLMDYDDQMIYAKTILERCKAVREHFQSQYPYICVDEAQDTSRIQHAIIQLLSQKSGNIFMVGDEDQSIYGFRAAYPDALMSFERDYPGARVLLMEENFRSTPEILHIADEFIRKNTNRRSKTICPVRESGAEVHEICVMDRQEQLEWLSAIAHTVEKPPAVLFRNNDSAIPLIDMLDRRKIPYRCRQLDDGFFTHRLVADIVDIAAFAKDGGNTDAFMRIYYKLGCGISKRAAELACRESRRSGKPVLYELLRFQELSPYALDSVSGLSEALALLLTDTAQTALSRIWNELRYGEYVRQMKLDTNKFAVLRLLARWEPTLEGLIRRMARLREIIAAPTHAEAPRLILSTVHSSKGLEYDVVYIMDILDGILPTITQPQSAEERRQYEEERRLFYVAVTRAKDELYLFRCTGQASAFMDEVQSVLPREETNDIFSSVKTELCGKRYTHAVNGAGVIAARCGGMCMIAYPGGKRQLMTIGQMYDQRAVVLKRPDKAAENEKSTPIKQTRVLTRAEERAMLARAVPGGKMVHSRFGAGSIVRFDAPLVEIAFKGMGVKKFVFLDSLRRGLLRFDGE